MKLKCRPYDNLQTGNTSKHNKNAWKCIDNTQPATPISPLPFVNPRLISTPLKLQSSCQTQAPKGKWNEIKRENNICNERNCNAMKRNETQGNEMKWNEMKWNEMKWNEMTWNEMKWNEMKRNEIKWNEITWNEIKWHKFHPNFSARLLAEPSTNRIRLRRWGSRALEHRSRNASLPRSFLASLCRNLDSW